MNTVKPIPEGYHSVTPVITVKDALALIDFMEKTFDATSDCMLSPDGTLMHAEISIGDSKIMVGEACDAFGPMPAAIFLYCENSDDLYRKAVDIGATSLMEPADMFWGDRYSMVKDRWGNQWSFATHIEDVPADEIKRRAEHAFSE